MAWSGGVDQSRPADALDPDQLSFATNSTFRGGPASNRPGLRYRPLGFAANTAGPFSTPAGPFQHAKKFDGAGLPCLMSSQAGRQFMINLTDFSVVEITPLKSDGVTLDVNSPVLPMGWSEQVENYWVFQDNQSLPIIFNGSTAVRANQALSQIPVGNVMCYAQGRLTVALPDGLSFRIGDLVFGASGTAQNQYRDASLYFTENNYLNEGGDFVARVFGAPSGVGKITMMTALAQPNTALGQGPLMVGTPYCMFTVQLPFDRTTWKNLANPMQTTTPLNGPLGQDSVVLVNTDVWYRGIDGFRSYIQTVRQDESSWTMTPMSNEIDATLAYDTQFLLPFGAGVFFDNRIIQLISPVQSAQGVWHRGMAVIDMNLVSGLRTNTSPAWEGVWSGLRFLKILKCMVNGVERCFIYTLNANTNAIELWELMPQDNFDTGPGGVQYPITWTLDTRDYSCGDYDAFKRLETGRAIVSNMVGPCSMTVNYRTDSSPCWQPWTTKNFCSKYQDCGPFGPPACNPPQTFREQERTPLKFVMPADNFDPIAKKKYRTGYGFQLQLINTGAYDLRQLRIYSLPEAESLSPEPNES